MTDTSEEILSKVADRVQFSAMPEVMAKLITMFDDPEMTAAEVADVMSKDAGLVTRVLRVANSAYYGGHGDVSNVQQALVKLGFRTTKAVALSSAVYSSISRSAPKDIDLRPFWQHGLEVGVTAMLLGEEVCGSYSDECFVAGMLHDVGRVALACAFPEAFLTLLGDAATPWTNEREREVFGVDHAETGAHLCKLWNFPEILVSGVADHHTLPESLPADAAFRVALCVGLADSMSSVSWAGPAATRTECRTYREAVSKLAGLDADRLQKIEAEAAPQVDDWAQLLEIQVCSPTDLLRQANERLFALYRAMDQLNIDNEKLHSQLLAEENERAALEALKVICATFSHHINNATTTILGRAQLVHLATQRGEQDELAQKVAQSMTVIENAVDTITEVLGELKCLSRFDTTSYHGRAEILKLKREVTARVT
jgi:putative nucleotidyltransferase with HDIG domain